MNLARRWVQWLGDVGVDSVHWTDVGVPTATDAAIFSYAHQNGLVVFTHDLDFCALLAHTRARGPSVIQVRTQDTSPEAIGHFILSALRQHAESLDAGALLTIDPSKARVRILPIR
jgi:predicted nuclease of predicted toxin-antitoxin system